MIRLSRIETMNLRSGTALGAGVFATPPEVSAVAATSGYYLSTLRVEEDGLWKVFSLWQMLCDLEPSHDRRCTKAGGSPAALAGGHQNAGAEFGWAFKD